ncbi:MAG TPA: hypothetical protein VGG89_03775 [Candidatus Baltobacteraceae bacterium]|jgi:hypothetical protein
MKSRLGLFVAALAMLGLTAVRAVPPIPVPLAFHRRTDTLP